MCLLHIWRIVGFRRTVSQSHVEGPKTGSLGNTEEDMCPRTGGYSEDFPEEVMSKLRTKGKEWENVPDGRNSMGKDF